MSAQETQSGEDSLSVAPETLDFLIGEARERYKAEHDRAGQAFTRGGVYLAVCGVYLTALSRYVDKPPPHLGASETVFKICAALFVLSVVFVVALVAWALIGPTLHFAVRPGNWIKHARALQAHFRALAIAPADEKPPGPHHPVDKSVHDELRTDVLLELSGAIDGMIAKNERKFWRLYLASLGIVLGLVLLVATTVSYAYVINQSPPQLPVTQVRITEPIRLEGPDKMSPAHGERQQGSAPIRDVPTDVKASNDAAPAASAP